MVNKRSFLRERFANSGFVVFLEACFVVLLLCSGAVHALDSNKRVTQYMHTSWQTQDGLAPASMSAIAQTSDGFLWFASDSGDLYRFDGVRFLPWRLPLKETVAATNLVGDHSGGLWVVGRSEVVHLKAGAVVSHFEIGALSAAQSVSEDPDGSLWVVRGLNSISDSPLCHVTDSGVKCFGKSDGIPICPIDSLLADGKGGFWLGGQTALVHWHAGATETYRIAALESNLGQSGIVNLALAPDGSLWVGIAGEGRGLGLAKLQGGNVKPFATSGFDGSKVGVSAIRFDRAGNLWVGALGKGLFRIHGDTVDHFSGAEGLSSDSVWDLFEDREGILWAATANGIDSFHDPRVTTFSALEGLGRDNATGILASKDGSLWVANSGLLNHLDKGVITSISTSAGLPGHQVASMLEDHSGNLWVGVDDGLYVLKQGRFRRLPESNHKPLGLVVGMAEDVDGNIWAECAGNPRKLVRIRDFQVREEFDASQVPPGHTLARDPKGGVWIGALGGDRLMLLRNGSLQTFLVDREGAPWSHQIIAQPDGSVLAASVDGVVLLRQGKVQRMTTKNGLPCNSVISFIQDKEKRWWLYTDCGIVELADGELQRWLTNPETMVQTHVYDALDGTRPGGPSFNPAAYSSDGRVWFVNGHVVQMLDPSTVSQPALPAVSYVESIVADRKEYTISGDLKFPPHPRDLQIDYTSPTFLIPQKVKFRYRLDGYNHDWKDAGTRRQAFYTDLPPGKYSFHVMACDNDGVWNWSVAKLDFSIAPAYYQTNWFRALCLLAFTALVWAIYQLRIRQMAREFNRASDARVEERTRIARELHDTLLQSFQGLLLRFKSVDKVLPDRPVEAKLRLEAALDGATRAITEARDAVQGLRESAALKIDLAPALGVLGEDLAAQAGENAPEFRVEVRGETRELHPVLRDEVYRIAAEALRNAFRHALARRIEVEIQYEASQLRVRVRDDGQGIDAKVLSGDRLSGHYGLPGMRERAKLIGGQLELWSEIHSGTEVELVLPATIAYAVGDRRWSPFEKHTKTARMKS
jgi:signal transduction histidine kinase/ligand-binding sensor domain-containing protein